jgi:hypothetical protein
MTDQTGALSFMGIASVYAAKMMIDDLNDRGGLPSRRVELFVQDSVTRTTTSSRQFGCDGSCPNWRMQLQADYPYGLTSRLRTAAPRRACRVLAVCWALPGGRHCGYSSFRQLRGSAGCACGVRSSRKL